MKDKSLKPIVLYHQFSLGFEEMIKQKLKVFSTTSAIIQEMLKGIFLSRKEKSQTTNMKMTKGKVSLVKANIQ